jgi:hypothetical protein
VKALFRKVADLSVELSGLDVLWFGLGAAGEAIVAAATPNDSSAFQARLVQPGGASFAKTRINGGRQLVVIRHDGTRARRFVVPHEVLTFPEVQPLPGDEVLVVGPRCRRFPDGTVELNGRVYGSDGQLRHEMLLGDGISHVQTTASGKVWVGYFDEGVLGNFGWGFGGDTEPVGASGLLRFDKSGNIEWGFVPPEGFGGIVDCYALNVVSDSEVWACYYTDFPLVRIGPADATRGWRTDVVGVAAIAANGEDILFFGGYKAERYRCQIGRLAERDVINLQDVQLEFESGGGFKQGRVASRGSALHVLSGASWFRLDIGEIGRP